MSVAIKVVTLPCTNCKPTRIKAICGPNSVTISKPDHTQHGDETAFEAVRAYCIRCCPSWIGVVWVAGYLEKDDAYVFTYLCDADTALGQRVTQGNLGHGIFISRLSEDPLVNAIAREQHP